MRSPRPGHAPPSTHHRRHSQPPGGPARRGRPAALASTRAGPIPPPNQGTSARTAPVSRTVARRPARPLGRQTAAARLVLDDQERPEVGSDTVAMRARASCLRPPASASALSQCARERVPHDRTSDGYAPSPVRGGVMAPIAAAAFGSGSLAQPGEEPVAPSPRVSPRLGVVPRLVPNAADGRPVGQRAVVPGLVVVV
jgi:hypothetical protein